MVHNGNFDRLMFIVDTLALLHVQVRIGLHAAQEVAAALDNAMDAEGAGAEAAIDDRLPLYDRMINAYTEVQGVIRATLQVRRVCRQGRCHGDIVARGPNLP